MLFHSFFAISNSSLVKSLLKSFGYVLHGLFITVEICKLFIVSNSKGLSFLLLLLIVFFNLLLIFPLRLHQIIIDMQHCNFKYKRIILFTYILHNAHPNKNRTKQSIQPSHFWIYAQRKENRALKRYLHSHIHGSIICSSQGTEST